MQKIPLEKAAEGMILAKPIARENGVVLMGEGTELNEQLIERLKGLDIKKVTVKGKPLGGEDEKSLEVLIAELEERFTPVLSDKLCAQIKDIIKRYNNAEKKPHSKTCYERTTMDHEKEKIRRKIKSIKSLPTLPEVALKISKMVEDDKTSATELGKIISTDPAISGRVLRLVNSSFYGFPGRISSISNAIILLGFDVVKSLIISVAVFEMMEKGILGLWEHSFGCAIASRLISKKVKGCDPEEVSVAGLLHDIGKIVVSIQLAEDYEEIKKTIAEKKINFSKAEKEVLELTHEDLGGWLAESWNLPDGLREPISCHHHPQQAQQAKLATAIVHLADFLVRAVGHGSGGDPWVPDLNHKAWERLGLSMHDLEEIISDFCDELESMESEELI